MVNANSVTARVASGIMRACFRRYNCASTAVVEESRMVVSDFLPARGVPGDGSGGVGVGPIICDLVPIHVVRPLLIHPQGPTMMAVRVCFRSDRSPQCGCKNY